MNPVKLSEKFTIYVEEYDKKHSIDEYLKFVELNDKLATHTNDDSVWVEVEVECFQSINSYIKDKIEKITGRKFVNYAQHYWVYTQKKGFNLEWMHQHIQVHPPGRSNILSDYTFTFYLQMNDAANSDEGSLVFEDENKIKHIFYPKVGDIFLFPGDIRHCPMPSPNSEKKRIVYAGSLCIDITNQKKVEKKTI